MQLELLAVLLPVFRNLSHYHAAINKSVWTGGVLIEFFNEKVLLVGLVLGTRAPTFLGVLAHANRREVIIEAQQE